MNTQGYVAVDAARKAVYDKVESQIQTVEAQLATLKAKAESAKADAELKTTGEKAFQQAKADVEARIATLGKAVKAIESKIKGDHNG
jgi:ABC-type phosphate transport system auxiliary subunit